MQLFLGDLDQVLGHIPLSHPSFPEMILLTMQSETIDNYWFKYKRKIHQWSLCGAMMKEWQFCDGGKQGGEGTVYRDANTHKHLQ